MTVCETELKPVASEARGARTPSDPIVEFFVEEGTRVKLRDIDPGYHGTHESPSAALAETLPYLEKMDQLQQLMYAEKTHALLIVLQGLDAAGKDGTARLIINNMDPAGCRVVGFKQPTAEDLDHDFLWRVHPRVPAKGEVAIFNRSHYEDVLIVRVHQLAPVNVWSKRYELINDFEKWLVMENNTSVLKFFLHISKEEQLARFKQRLDDPAQHWKISESDYKEREYWDNYMDAFEDMLYQTSTRHAPWFVIPSNCKWFRNLAVTQIISRTLDDLALKLPKPKVDIADIRRRYHAAEDAAEQHSGAPIGSHERIHKTQLRSGVAETSNTQNHSIRADSAGYGFK